MKLIKLYLNNNFYFVLFCLGITLISYLSIYDALVITNSIVSSDTIVDSKYSLSILKQGISSKFLTIPLNFLKLSIYYIFFQIICINVLSTYFDKIINNKVLILFVFVFSCYLSYVMSVFINI